MFLAVTNGRVLNKCLESSHVEVSAVIHRIISLWFLIIPIPSGLSSSLPLPHRKKERKKHIHCIKPPLPRTPIPPVTAHFVAPAQFVASDKMCTLNSTFCRTLHKLSPEDDKMCSRSRHILSPRESARQTVRNIQCYLAFGIWPVHYVRRTLLRSGETIPP